MKEISINAHGLSTMCRLCLASDVTVNIFAFSTKMSDQLIASVIMKCAPVQITRRDGMPNLICQLCFTQLEKIHQFQMQIVKSDETLRRYVQQLGVSDKQTETECSIQGPTEGPSVYETIAAVTVKCEPLEIHDVPDNDNSIFSAECADGNSFRDDCSKISCEDTKISVGDVVLTGDINIVNWREKVPEKFYSGDKISDAGSSKFEYRGDDALIQPGNIEDKHIKTECSIQGPSEDFNSKIKDEPMVDNFIFLPENAEDTVKITENIDERQKRKHVTSLNHISNKKVKTNNTKLNQSTVCNKNSKSSVKIQKHIHTVEKPHLCDICNKLFTTSNSLKCHKRIHTGEKPYQCDVCSRCFTVSSHLTDHKRTHTGEKPYQCDMCNKCFSSFGNLYNHKRIHTGEKPFQCDVCSKCFPVSRQLIDHKRTHTGDKPYQCDLCQKYFTRSDILNKHKRTHTGEKPYQCDVCSKCFTTSSYLKIHKLIHTSEKPFEV